MRTEEERMKLIRQRASQIRKKEKQRQQRMIDIGCIAACLLLVLCVGMFMPGISSQMSQVQIDNLSPGAASIFGGSGALGYIFMGILCFSLGVFVTILLYRIHHRNKGKDSDEL